MTAKAQGQAWLADETDTSTPVAPPVQLAAPDDANWDASCDVLVIGAGLAGTTAALRAAEDDGLEVIAVDRGEGGGASYLSGGVLYLGGTRVQQECGIADSAENMANYLAYEAGDVVRPETLRRFTEQSAAMIPWLEKWGARFGGPATDAKTSYPGTAFLYYSGNEKTRAGKAVATPAPRGHRALPLDGKSVWALSGTQLMTPLLASLKARPNAQLWAQTTARRLITDDSGRVIGAEVWRLRPGSAAARTHRMLLGVGRNMVAAVLGVTAPAMRAAARIERAKAERLRVRVRRGVVLSAGGFVYNRTMMARFAPAYLAMAPLGTIGDDGSGIKLGASVGGATDRMGTISAWRFLYPPATWTKGIMVGPDGKRAVNEEEYGARTGEALFERCGGKAWVVLDHSLQHLVEADTKDPELQPYQRMSLKPALRFNTRSAPTIGELADKIGITRAALEATVAEYNSAISEGRPDAFDKGDAYRRPITDGPFFATDISATAKMFPVPGLTMGGLTPDEETGAVLDGAGQPVRGLYAAGRNAVGICSGYYVSGTSLADCVFSGLRAADSIRREAGEANA